MSLPKNKSKIENSDKKSIGNKFKKDDMLDFIDKELKMFNKDSNNDKQLILNKNSKINLQNNSLNNKNMNLQLKNLPSGMVNQNISLSLKKNNNQPVLPNDLISNILYY